MLAVTALYTLARYHVLSAALTFCGVLILSGMPIAAGDLDAKREGGSMKLAAGAVVNCLPVLLERSSASQDSRTAAQTRMVARTVALVVKVRQVVGNVRSAGQGLLLSLTALVDVRWACHAVQPLKLSEP